MNIISFNDNIRIGSNWPNVVDVKPLPGQSEASALMAKCSTYFTSVESGYVQVRKSNQYNEIALITCQYKDGNKLPPEWEDSMVIWDSRTNDIDSAQSTQMSN
jgi:hypothetical protein